MPILVGVKITRQIILRILLRGNLDLPHIVDYVGFLLPAEGRAPAAAEGHEEEDYDEDGRNEPSGGHDIANDPPTYAQQDIGQEEERDLVVDEGLIIITIITIFSSGDFSFGIARFLLE